MTRVRRTGAYLVILLLLSGVIGACASDSPISSDIAAVEEPESSDDNLAQAVYKGAPAAEPAAAPGAHYGAVTQSSSDSGAGSGGSDGGGLATDTDVLGRVTEAPAVGPSVIKTADVELEVDRDGLEQAVRDGIATAGRFGGFVLSTSMQEESRGSATVVLRIPADNFERALAELEDLGKVDGEIISGRDIGQEFVDLEARIRNLEAQETVLLRLMDRSQSVSDTIRVQRELQGVQLELERLTGRVRYLRDQADMATIALSMKEEGAPVPKPGAGALQKAWGRATDVALGVISAVIVGVGAVLPIALLVALGYVVVRLLRPRLSS
jgi:Domain of unknown function (DUF4349)